MTGSAECARTTDTLVDVARKMRDLDVGALPICGDDDRLKGMITDRDIVVRAVADGTDPSSRRPTPSPRASRSPSVRTTRSRRRSGR